MEQQQHHNSFFGKLLLGLLGKKTLPNSTISSPCSPSLPESTIQCEPTFISTSTTIDNNKNNSSSSSSPISSLKIINNTENENENENLINEITNTSLLPSSVEKDEIYIKKLAVKFVDDSIPTEYERKKVYSKFRKQLNENDDKEMVFNEFYNKTKHFYHDNNIKEDIQNLIKIRPIQFLELKEREIQRIENSLIDFPQYKDKLLNLVENILNPFENDFLKNIEEIYPKLWLYSKTKKFIISNKIYIYKKVKDEAFKEFGEYVDKLIMINQNREFENEKIKQFKKSGKDTYLLPKRIIIGAVLPPTMNRNQHEKDQFFVLIFIVYLIQNSTLFSISKLNFINIIKNTIKYLYIDNDEDLKEFIKINNDDNEEEEEEDDDDDDEKEHEKEDDDDDDEDDDEELNNNYKSLIKLLKSGDYYCLTGTGVSIGLAESYISILTWEGLINSISEEYSSSSNNEDTLLKHLNEMISKKEITLVEAVDLLNLNYNSKGLDYKKTVYKILNNAQPTIFSNPSQSIAEIIRSLSVPIITTNYDHLLETCLNRQSFDSIGTNKHGNKFNDFKDHREKVYHIHGSMDNIDGICLSRDEYTLSTPFFLSTCAQLRNKSFFILGFGSGLTDDHWLPFLKHSSVNHYWICSKESLINKGTREFALSSNQITNVRIVEYLRENSSSYVNFLWKLVFNSNVEQITFSNTLTINQISKSFNLTLSWDSINSKLLHHNSTTLNNIDNDNNYKNNNNENNDDKQLFYYENVFIKKLNQSITNNYYKKSKSIKVLFFTNDIKLINCKPIFIAGGFNHWKKEKVEFIKNEKTMFYQFEITLPVGKNFYQFSIDNDLKLVINQPTGKYIMDEKKSDHYLTKNIIDSQMNPNPIELKF
ncbi:hypothetical protein DDB_G0275869 [Dictyostelium discoideum AX4]|uniref:Uncharacterized protein n=1 Tax=Dictyostelium discoideum TaxID=44689 RepID=Q553A5_DICDI|nr:hypothetical protein DDB_G0275869 [Dictyostelium discoideum AX4]EAL69685.1 hypothetical protein DDB_G0275869 [Dictyostelium discoideum AX4]|eukprot:XP_643515.1 hypothetical protein DDB_G0275869 [Dictyostelium discoideum AX4]